MAEELQFTLRVEAPHFTAGADWQLISGEWYCHTAAPVIAWVKRYSDPAVLEDYFRRKSWSFMWGWGGAWYPSLASAVNAAYMSVRNQNENRKVNQG